MRRSWASRPASSCCSTSSWTQPSALPSSSCARRRSHAAISSAWCAIWLSFRKRISVSAFESKSIVTLWTEPPYRRKIMGEFGLRVFGGRAEANGGAAGRQGSPAVAERASPEGPPGGRAARGSAEAQQLLQLFGGKLVGALRPHPARRPQVPPLPFVLGGGRARVVVPLD